MKALAITPTTPAERLRRAIAGILDNALIEPLSGPRLGYGFKTLDDVVEALAQAAERNLTTDSPVVMSPMNSQLLTGTYFETLSDAFDAVEARLQAKRAVPAEDWRNRLNSHLNYGETRNLAFRLESLNGKPTRNGFNVSIFRFDNTGRYELTFYIA